ncbi:hypothetical protein PSTG_14287 [Puccinia striiformis f. sp. tritici PST-78]|uniref:WIBG Mago-binding domain-containing protein n=1 Tax=Puccinia striiformis f. sp. tritici PST-78 TaxID=1165861 RepID=A0A0L0UZY5_9BASI|nr:hypothetical protein PSTG_14287 [Puccinia striiformis f. sp. tritici PST-78]
MDIRCSCARGSLTVTGPVRPATWSCTNDPHCGAPGRCLGSTQADTEDRMPSRPPFLSELTPSTSGIVLDPTTGNREVATSKRPDGTWVLIGYICSLRKEIKTRPGFTPHEDVSKFRSARQSEFESKKLPKGSVVGLIRPQVAVAQSALRGMSDAPKKKAKQKEKCKTGIVKTDMENTPNQWDCSSTGSNPQDHPTSGSANQVKSTPDPPADEPAVPRESQSRQGSLPLGLKEDHTIPSTNKKERSGKEGVNLFTSAVQSIEDSKSMEKRARAIHKKLTQAEQLKVQQEAGETLLAEQLDKMTKIHELQVELENMKLS